MGIFVLVFCFIAEFSFSKYSFAHISDVLIGNETTNFDNFNNTLRNAISDGVQFILVTGDLTESSQQYQFNEFVSISSEMKVPLISTLGNNDIWEINDGVIEEPPKGDERFYNSFGIPFIEGNSNVSNYHGNIMTKNPDIHYNVSMFQNFLFRYEGSVFLFLDWNSRKKSTSSPYYDTNGNLNDCDHNGTLTWFKDRLSELSSDLSSFDQIFLVQSIPFKSYFSSSDRQTIQEAILSSTIPLDKFYGDFAGELKYYQNENPFSLSVSSNFSEWNEIIARSPPCYHVYIIGDDGQVESVSIQGGSTCTMKENEGDGDDDDGFEEVSMWIIVSCGSVLFLCVLLIFFGVALVGGYYLFSLGVKYVQKEMNWITTDDDDDRVHAVELKDHDEEMESQENNIMGEEQYQEEERR